MFQLFDEYAASGMSLLFLMFFECIAVSWGFGARLTLHYMFCERNKDLHKNLFRRFRLAMHDMIGYYPSYFFVGCWSVLTPAICGGVFFFKVGLDIDRQAEGFSKQPPPPHSTRRQLHWLSRTLMSLVFSSFPLN